MVLGAVVGNLSALVLARKADSGLQDLLRARVAPATSPLFGNRLGCELPTAPVTPSNISSSESARTSVAMAWTRLTVVLGLKPLGDPDRRCDWAGCTSASSFGAVKLSSCSRCKFVQCASQCPSLD